MASTNPVLRASITHARAVQTGDPAKVAAARADLNAAKIEAFVRRTLESAPPLSTEQRRRIARLLTGGER